MPVIRSDIERGRARVMVGYPPRYLESQGVAAVDRAELTAAIKTDRGKVGPRVKAWLGEMVVKAATSGGRIGEGAAGGLIALAVARFLNMA